MKMWKTEMNEAYLNRGLDMKRLMLYFQRKIWLVIMLAILGGTLGGVIYQVIKAVKMPVEYEAVSKLYISFGHDESGEVYQYYNGYTWNDLIGADPILDMIMKGLPGYERNQVRASIKAEILSDIRLLTITVGGESEKFVREIRKAVETGLTEYAQNAEELKQIKVIRSQPPERVFWNDRTTQACTAGAIILGVLSLIILLFSYTLNEAVFVQEDIEKKYGCKALGILTRNQKGLQPYARELKASLTYVLGEQKTFAILDMGNHADMRKLELERLMNSAETEILGAGMPEEADYSWSFQEEIQTLEEEKTSENRSADEWQVLAFNENIMSEPECRQMRESGGVILLLPFGTDAGRKTQRMLSLLQNQDCRILGMIIAQADEEFLNRYYA